MPNYVFKCPDAHESEIYLTFAEKKELGDTIPCPQATSYKDSSEHEHAIAVLLCGKTAQQVFTRSLTIYNSPGFYGNVGTEVASGVTGM